MNNTLKLLSFFVLGLFVMGTYNVLSAQFDIGLLDGLGDTPKTISDDALAKIEIEATEKGISTSEVLIDKGISVVESQVIADAKAEYRTVMSKVWDLNDYTIYKSATSCLTPLIPIPIITEEVPIINEVIIE